MGWKFDPDHTQVEWACAYLGISLIKGSFNRMTAEVNVEDPDPSKWSISADIDPSSLVSAGFGRREEALKGENFLEAEQFPKLTFRSTRVARKGEDLDVTGQLELHGVTREITFTGSDNGEGVDRRGVRRRGFSARTHISRDDFSIPTNGPSFVADRVDLAIEAQLIWEEQGA